MAWKTPLILSDMTSVWSGSVRFGLVWFWASRQQGFLTRSSFVFFLSFFLLACGHASRSLVVFLDTRHSMNFIIIYLFQFFFRFLFKALALVEWVAWMCFSITSFVVWSFFLYFLSFFYFFICAYVFIFMKDMLH